MSLITTLTTPIQTPTNAQVTALAQAAIPDPLDVMDLRDEFASALFTTGNIGSLGWNFTNGTVAVASGATGHPGVIRRGTSTTSNIASFYLRNTASSSPPLNLVEMFDETWVVKPNHVDGDTQIRIGFSDNWPSDTPATAMFFEKLLADTNWFAVNRAASVQATRIDTGVAASTASWIKFRLRRIDASTIGFSINGGTEITQTASVPTAGVQPGIYLFNNTAADKTMDIDFFRLRITGLGR